MAECILLNSGEGIDSDEVTAGKAQVLTGYTALTKDSDDEAVYGTMPNNGTQNASLNCGQWWTIPKGYTDGGVIVANSLASQTSGATADDSKVLNASTYWKDGIKRTGKMPNIGAIEPAKSVVLSGSSLYARMSNGAHITNASSGYPEISIPQSSLATAIGLTSNKLSRGQSVAGINGTAFRSASVYHVAFNDNIYYTGYSNTCGNRSINIGAPYADWDTLVMQIRADTEFRGPVCISLSKGHDMRVPIILTKWNDAQYDNTWLSVARKTDGTITLSPFRGNKTGTFRTVVEILAVFDGIVNNES